MSDDMHDRSLQRLRHLTPPEPSDAARERAVMAALAAFDAAGEAEAKKSAGAPQGKLWLDRLKSIIPTRTGNWTMDIRIPLGTAAIALLLLPLGYQLYTSTAFTPIDARQERISPPRQEEAPREPAPLTAETADSDSVAPAPLALPEPAPIMPQTAAAPPPAMDMEAPIGRTSAAPPPNGGAMMESAAARPAPALAPTESGDRFAAFSESPVKAVAQEPVSTFSVDVDTASYSYVRRMLEDGFMPEADAVRIEEMVNYFPYAYPAPETRDVPFKPSMAVFPTPWNPKTQILQIGIKGYVPPVAEDKPSNLVFLVDTSGSMDEPDKLPLLKRAFSLLVEQLSANDTVSIVVYAGSAGVVLEPTRATDKAKILSALDNLQAGGSTAGAEGIALAYQLAEQAKIADGVNRVILATDGDFNVGISDPEELKAYIKRQRESGVFLSVLGFGQGNLDDALMQALAQNGNGNAAYIDSFREAQKVLVEEGGSTLETIAKDVKIQVEFNPAVVAEYRLIGYETRALNREDFNNDKVDAGDIGAGHTVTALYEITPAGSGAELVDPLRYGEAAPAVPQAAAPQGTSEIAFLKMRYKLPAEDTSRLIEMPVTRDLVVDDIARAPEDMRFAAAVAAFGQKLKGSNHGGDMSYAEIRDLAQGARGIDASGYRAEFVQLVNAAALLDTAGSGRP